MGEEKLTCPLSKSGTYCTRYECGWYETQQEECAVKVLAQWAMHQATEAEGA